MTEILTWLIIHRKKVAKAALALLVAFLLTFGIGMYKQNKVLSERLELAQNNIEAYQGSIQESWLANNVLKLDIDELKYQNDKLLHEIDSVRKQINIKPKQVKTAATQTLVLSVIGKKEVEKDIVEILKDTTYTDSLKYNDLTTVYYTIGTDTVSIKLEVKNTQYLYVYSTKEYKHKKNFLARLFTLDFKKVNKYKYKMVNTNELLNTEDVRVIESN